ncbi:MAG: hypothetical protein DCE90_15760 [Pseudanabaena sp.]|nr:MAG: hypothetical protein DCE90_15760 [Pseudanabaena sp.]
MRQYLTLSLSAIMLLGNAVSAEEKKPVKPEKYEYPQEVVRTFMKGCGFTSNKAYCTCSLDKLRSRYTFAEFLEIDKSARETNQVPKEVISLFQSCRTQFPN